MKHLSLTSISRPTFFLSPAALVLAASIFIAASPDAIAMGGGNGNPFSNGTFFPNEGTFQTTIRGVNLSGVATFSTGGSGSSNSTTTPSSGSFTVSYQGTSYTGDVDASMDSAGGTIAATMESSVARQGSGTLTTNSTISSSFEQVGTQTDIVPGGQSIYVDPITGVVTTFDNPDTAVTTDVFSWVDTSLNSRTTYQDTLYTSGSFNAKLKNSFPNQIFKGQGTMAFTAINFALTPPQLTTTTVNISVKGSRTSNTAQTYTSTTATAPSVITTTTTSVGNRTN